MTISFAECLLLLTCVAVILLTIWQGTIQRRDYWIQLTELRAEMKAREATFFEHIEKSQRVILQIAGRPVPPPTMRRAPREEQPPGEQQIEAMLRDGLEKAEGLARGPQG